MALAAAESSITAGATPPFLFWRSMFEKSFAEILLESLCDDCVLTKEETGLAIANIQVYYDGIEHKRRET